MKKVILSVLLLGLSLQISAQEKESSIPEVTVQGKFLELPIKKVNENITVVSKEEIENSPSKSVEELLAEFTGFDIRRRGGNGVQADISLRGSSFEQVLILVNGVRMNDSQTGHNSMSLPFDLASVEKIEIIKGPAARRFGQNAYAGVVNIITKVSSEEKVIVSASGGDYKTYSLGLGANFGNEKFSNFIQVGSTSSEGYRHNTDYKINNIFYQNQFKINDGQIKFQAGIQEKKFGANGFYSSPTATEQYEETQASIVSLGYEQKFNQFNLNSTIYWRRGQDLYLFNREKPEVYRNMHIGNNVGAELNGSYTSTLGTTGLGVEFRKEFLASNNLGHRERFLTQIFLEHHFSLIQNKLQISPGISWANYDSVGDFFYPGLDIGFDFNENHKIYGNVAKVNRIPTFTDLFYVSKTEIGNPDLKPENAISSELGYRFQKNNFLGKVSVFNRTSDNSIDWVKETQDGIWSAENIGKIETNGVEVEFGQRFNSFVKSYSLGYTYLDSKAKEPQNLISRYVMENLKHQFVAKLETRFFKNITNQLIYKYNERVTTGSYQLLDGKLGYDLKDLNLYVLINNITNANYTETFGVPMPKRWFHVGFTLNLSL
ncbi:TonB-dependent receptor plug domain-containing protein [Kaistella antarctica]|uniref:Outer membrane cobalamin translocator n=1 Tax=Kaistella antarctica TaxID=266748 RepID=A0A448NNF1_9FLAO|nr:TonB-dependent receptor [Kaistella antarctica]KEY19786.1 TonB-dependent receptor [Kaistella antarctica]SEV97717.1 iron complex outermembrane recepter protein [Kaistella antarctica]VEH96476.1 Outer membrane cobalamin translocator [Kaistella antarctica]